MLNQFNDSITGKNLDFAKALEGIPERGHFLVTIGEVNPVSLLVKTAPGHSVESIRAVGPNAATVTITKLDWGESDEQLLQDQYNRRPNPQSGYARGQGA